MFKSDAKNFRSQKNKNNYFSLLNDFTQEPRIKSDKTSHLQQLRFSWMTSVVNFLSSPSINIAQKKAGKNARSTEWNLK